MTALAAERTIEVMPLGRRGRYSLTPTQQRAYLALVAFYDDQGHMPSLADWAACAGLWGRANACAMRTELATRGWITTKVGKKGTEIELLDPVLRNLKPVEPIDGQEA